METLAMILITIGAMAAPAAQPAPAPKSEAGAVWQQVVATYRAMRTYSDRGTSVTQLKADKAPSQVIVTFETEFQRPDNFSFRWTLSPHPGPGTVWNVLRANSQETSVTMVAVGTKPMKRDSLSKAIGGSSGHSHETVGEIARLLSDKVGGRRLDEMTHAELGAIETVTNVPCQIVTGRDASGGEVTVWIGQTDHLIRKISVKRADGTTRDEVRTDIKVDADIPQTAFYSE